MSAREDPMDLGPFLQEYVLRNPFENLPNGVPPGLAGGNQKGKARKRHFVVVRSLRFGSQKGCHLFCRVLEEAGRNRGPKEHSLSDFCDTQIGTLTTPAGEILDVLSACLKSVLVVAGPKPAGKRASPKNCFPVSGKGKIFSTFSLSSCLN